MITNYKQVKGLYQLLGIVAILNLLGGTLMLYILWEESRYVAVYGFIAGLGGALLIYIIMQFLVITTNIEKNTRKIQEYFEILMKSLSKK